MEARLERGRSNYTAGYYQSAQKIALSLVRDGHASEEVWRLLGVASCQLGDGRRAVNALQQLDAGSRAPLVSLCARHGIMLDEPDLN